MRIIAIVTYLAIWALFATTIVNLAPFPAGERHCDEHGCWDIVTE